MLIGKEEPVVRDQGGRQDRVGFPAFRASNTADTEILDSLRNKYPALVIRVDRQAAGMTAGACQLMELKGVYERYVIILRKPIVIFDRNKYHGLVRHSSYGCDWLRDSRYFLRVRAVPFSIYGKRYP